MMHDPVQSDGQMKITSIHKAVSTFRMFSSGHDSFNGIPINQPLTGHPCARVGARIARVCQCQLLVFFFSDMHMTPIMAHLLVYRVRSMGYQLREGRH